MSEMPTSKFLDIAALAHRALERDELRHNLGTLKRIHGGLELALRERVEFDPRRDYWLRIERRFLVAYLCREFPQWPSGPGEERLAQFALWLAHELESLRTPVASSTADSDTPEGASQLLTGVHEWCRGNPHFEHWSELQQRRQAAPSVAQSLLLFCEEMKRSGFSPSEPGIGQKLRWFAVLGAQDQEELARRQRFFLAYRFALMSHNSYRKAGAQQFGPVIGNTPFRQVLDVLARWRAGASLRDAPLLGTKGRRDTPQDFSGGMTAIELWGFFHLHEQPFYNTKAQAYLEVDRDPQRAVQKLGRKTGQWLRENSDHASKLAARFDELVRDHSTRSNFKDYKARPMAKGEESTLDRRFYADLQHAAQLSLLALHLDAKAAILLHLQMDRMAYAEAESVNVSPLVREEIESPRLAASSTALRLRDQERVWIYAPGRNASNWANDLRGGRASIGYEQLDDLRSYATPESMLEALREGWDQDSEPTGAVRTCWRFANELRPGDPILAKKGRSRILGIGRIEGPYEYHAEEPFPHRLPVRWLWSGDHAIQERGSLPITTLAEASERTKLLRELEALLSGGTREEMTEEDEAPPAYQRADALGDLFLPDEQLDQMLELLRRKKNLVLQGPPGVGKTFVAKRLAYLLLGAKDDSRVKLVQFHQAYTYEQFVRGYRPDGKGGFALGNGPLFELAETAKSDAGQPYVLIIDEINRGNLSKILGEGMMLLEADKRAPEWGVQLAYRSALDEESDERFYLPPNLHFIGTMNTADRSLAVVDYALRRRFSFVTLRPGLDHPRFAEHLGSLPTRVMERLRQIVRTLNQRIREDGNLGLGFEIGHSYFCHGDRKDEAPWSADPEAWLDAILRYELLPLLEEYWYDDGAKLADARALLSLIER
ncbi:MAG: AAA family ATPase [Planctomycetes bacterium]|nr:AAA family ATPase [Planctomycetota bacterium]